MGPGKPRRRMLKALLGVLIACAGLTTALARTAASSGADPPQSVLQTPPAPLSTTSDEARIFSPVPYPPGNKWRTNQEKYIVDPASLGPGNIRDAIPPIYEPQFESLEAADSWLENDDVVGVLALEDQVHVYPLRILVWHEVVNDQLGSVPVVVTFCPLCNTLIAFNRSVAGESLVFGVSGKLQNDNLIMWDHQTESWWQQATGLAIVGDMVGEQLDLLPVRSLFWREVRQNMPLARVLSRESGFQGSEAGFYDIKVCPTDYSKGLPLWTGGPTSDALPYQDRVVGLNLSAAVAYPLSALAQKKVVNDVVDGHDVVLFYSAEPCFGTLAGLGAETVDTASVYSPLVGEKKLSFYLEDGEILDRETSSTWTPGGLAVLGQLKGRQLEPLPSTISFWFSWVGFFPDTELRLRE